MITGGGHKVGAVRLWPTFTALAVISVMGWATGPTAKAQDISENLQCLRYLQSYERSMNIPRGLLMAIAFVESGRPTGVVSVTARDTRRVSEAEGAPGAARTD